MIVPFSEINKKTGKPTLFIDKIWFGMWSNNTFTLEQYRTYLKAYEAKFGKSWDLKIWRENKLKAKIHTLRADEKGRYQPGKLIHPFINNRTKQMFQFAPVFPVVSTQEIIIMYGMVQIDQSKPFVYVDGLLQPSSVVQQIALNDGFESLEDFLYWFDEDFTGKIIHFTSFRY